MAMHVIRTWFRRYFSDPQAVLLAVLLIAGFAVIMLMGEMLAPAIAAIVIAYLLDSPVQFLRRLNLPHLTAVIVVFLGFIGLALFALFTVLPLVTAQFAQLVASLPSMMGRIQDALLKLPESYPALIDEAQVLDIMARLRSELLSAGQYILQFSLDNVANLVTVVVYAILVPLMVFFFLKDKDKVIAWVQGFLPRERELVNRVWHEVNHKTGHYVRGKAYEIIIVGVVTWAALSLIDIQFAILLALMTGFSVLIPYVGAALVFFPVAFVAFVQWGVSTEFAIAVAVYLVIQALDGNLLAPLLLSEVVKLHPNAVIAAILIFGGLWGIWGLFFAIPLATLAEAVLNAWPRSQAQTAKPPPGREAPKPPEPEDRAPPPEQEAAE